MAPSAAAEQREDTPCATGRPMRAPGGGPPTPNEPPMPMRHRPCAQTFLRPGAMAASALTLSSASTPRTPSCRHRSNSSRCVQQPDPVASFAWGPARANSGRLRQPMGCLPTMCWKEGGRGCRSITGSAGSENGHGLKPWGCQQQAHAVDWQTCISMVIPAPPQAVSPSVPPPDPRYALRSSSGQPRRRASSRYRMRWSMTQSAASWWASTCRPPRSRT